MANAVRLGFLTHVEGQADLATLYRRLITQFVAAEELGFDSGWIAQHHFEDGRSGAGAGASPFVLLAAVAERTSRIRLGTAVMTIPLENPLRLAEDAATVDLISGGRVELGIGSGFDEMTFAAFGVPIAERRESTSRGTDLLYKALNGEPLLADGRAVLQPQSPGLAGRVWQGIFSELGARHVAATGSHLLLNRAAYGYDARTDLVQRPWADAYLDEWGRHAKNRARTPCIGASRFIYPAADKATAKSHLEAGVVAFRQTPGGGGPVSAGPRHRRIPCAAALFLRPPGRDHRRITNRADPADRDRRALPGQSGRADLRSDAQSDGIDRNKDRAGDGLAAREVIRDLSRCARAALTLEQRDNLDCIHAHYGRPGGNVTAFGCAPATSRRSCLSGRDYGVQDEIDKAIDYVCEEHENVPTPAPQDAPHPGRDVRPRRVTGPGTLLSYPAGNL